MCRSACAATLALFLQGGCSESPGLAAGEPALAGPLENSIASMPDLVLDGTDLVPLEDVQRTGLPPSPSGDYRVEAGGSEITVTIVGSADGSWSVTRVYREPGLVPHARRYQAQRSGELLVAPGDGLTIQGTEEGVLMLETESGVESIPADFWIHYIRSEKAD